MSRVFGQLNRLQEPHFEKLAGAFGDGHPGWMLQAMQRAGNVAPTPTNIGTAVARCSSFRLPFNLLVNTIRFYGVGAVTTTYTCALYRYSDLARLTSSLTFTTASNTWGTAGTSLAIPLYAGEHYFIACSVNTTGTTAGIAAFGGTTAATTGAIQTAPQSLPGNLDFDADILSGYQFQFAVTSGAMPNPAATLAAQASAWTGGMPAFFLDNA